MNEYLSAMTDIIEAHGGFVDKYIGDAIVAVFGAPLDDPRSRHQRGARRAAMRRARCPSSNACAAAFGGRPVAAAHRAQHRRGAGRQHRLAAALQLHGDGRHGEPRLAAGGRQQVLRHHDHGVGDDGGADRRDVRLARARRHPGEGPQPGGEDLRAARARRRGAAGRGARARQPMRTASPATAPRDFAGAASKPSAASPTIRLPRNSPRGRGNSSPSRPARTGSRSTRWTKSDAARRHARRIHVALSTKKVAGWPGLSPAMTRMGDPRPSQISTASAIFNP